MPRWSCSPSYHPRNFASSPCDHCDSFQLRCYKSLSYLYKCPLPMRSIVLSTLVLWFSWMFGFWIQKKNWPFRTGKTKSYSYSTLSKDRTACRVEGDPSLPSVAPPHLPVQSAPASIPRRRRPRGSQVAPARGSSWPSKIVTNHKRSEWVQRRGKEKKVTSSQPKVRLPTSFGQKRKVQVV